MHHFHRLCFFVIKTFATKYFCLLSYYILAKCFRYLHRGLSGLGLFLSGGPWGLFRTRQTFMMEHYRSSHRRCSMKKALRPRACNFVEKETLAQVLSCELCEISKNTFFTEHVWATASDIFQNGSIQDVWQGLILRLWNRSLKTWLRKFNQFKSPTEKHSFKISKENFCFPHLCFPEKWSWNISNEVPMFRKRNDLYLALSCIILKIGQTYFKNFVVWKQQDFKSIFGPFFNVIHESVKNHTSGSFKQVSTICCYPNKQVRVKQACFPLNFKRNTEKKQIKLIPKKLT